jgi:hypothetical protein
LDFEGAIDDYQLAVRRCFFSFFFFCVFAFSLWKTASQHRFVTMFAF